MDPITDEEDVNYYSGRCYFQEKDYIKAIEIYKEGLTINPKSVILLYEIGFAYSKLENKKRAIRYWKKLLRVVSPHSFLALTIKQILHKKELY